jgi:hypothetical protein
MEPASAFVSQHQLAAICIMKRKKACMIFYQNTLFLLFIVTAINI